MVLGVFITHVVNNSFIVSRTLLQTAAATELCPQNTYIYFTRIAHWSIDIKNTAVCLLCLPAAALSVRKQHKVEKMPFWKKEKDNGKSKEKVNYKSRLEHKQYLVSSFSVFVNFIIAKKERTLVKMKHFCSEYSIHILKNSSSINLFMFS